MKILKVRFQNLNSLTGSHEIDLSDGPLADSGIFAITGPTGAGKSTILDAITLALYGRAARYEGETNPHDMMSRHTGECSAEVVFEVAAGQYRAAWHLNRARKKPTGKVQPARRFLYDSADQPIAQKINDVNDKVAELVGLDVNRFLRSVLLAQNEFAKFLRSSADERSTLLEQLTGTSIYSRLGQLAHEMYGEKDKELHVEKAQIDAIQLLSDEERKERGEELTRTTAGLKELNKQVEKNRQLIEFGEQAERLSKRKSDLAATLDELQKESRAFAPSLKQMERHALASGFRAEVDGLANAEQATKAAADALGEANVEDVAATFRLGYAVDALGAFEEKQVVKINESLDSLLEERKETTQQLDELEAWLNDNVCDASLAAATGDVGTVLTKLGTDRGLERQAVTKREEQQKNVEETAESIAELQKTCDAANKAREQQDKVVTEQTERLAKLAGGRTIEQLQAAVDEARARLQQLNDVEGLSTKFAELQTQCSRLETELKKHDAVVEDSHKKLLATESEWKQQVELVAARRTALHRGEVIASLEEHRHELKDDEECPLCGALEHPFTDGADGANVGESRLKEEKRQLLEAESLEKKREEAHGKAEAAHTESKNHRQGVASKLDLLITQSSELQVQVATAAGKLGLAATDRDSVLEAARLQNENLIESDGRLKNVRAAHDEFDEAEKLAIKLGGQSETVQIELDGQKKAIALIEDDIKSSKKGSEKLQERIKSYEQQLQTLLKDFLPAEACVPAPEQEQVLRKELEARAVTYGSKVETQRKLIKQQADFDSRQTEFERSRKQIHSSCEACRGSIDGLGDWKQASHPKRPNLAEEMELQCAAWSTLDKVEDEIGMLLSRRQAATVKVSERENVVKRATSAEGKLRASLEERIAPSEFEDPASIRVALLAEEVLETLQLAKSDLDRRGSENRGQLTLLETELLELKKQPLVSEERLAELRVELAEQLESEKQLSAVMTELEVRIRDDDKNRKTHATRTKGIESELQMLESWRKLRGLIGSGDGKKFRVFAQGLSLDVLVQLANKHLQKLSDRYRLRRVAGEQLDLEISDQHQAGTLRPMKSLSGGESFVASLALALGLSDLAGRNVRIDSLFIDEGFGSLDPETLDVAVAALEGLQATNKTIGVISHVELLKERITTQIRVTPKGGGVSELAVVG